ncbi:hypothetical protein ACFV2H_43405 [Streptomyces sp. NPDC059629]|uniref:hypothetical protein n=1 Tax=Streptomyces sp. NPDC059629 TaxID=3346889 RepID=UPI0036CA7313
MAESIGARPSSFLAADPDADAPWPATPYVPGPTLAQHLAAHGPLEGGTLYAFATGTAQALAAPRTGVIPAPSAISGVPVRVRSSEVNAPYGPSAEGLLPTGAFRRPAPVPHLVWDRWSDASRRGGA